MTKEKEIEEKIKELEKTQPDKVISVNDLHWAQRDYIKIKELKAELKGFQLGKSQAQKDILEMLKEFERQFCYPNKPMNTFQYARELKEGVEELTQKIKEMK
jgi:hypothetical protein